MDRRVFAPTRPARVSPVTVIGPTAAPPSHGKCSNFFNGYLPGQVLGLNNLDASGYALDGYPLANGQGRIRYAIADLTIGATYCTRP